ncbi:MAG: hypothetical protein JJE03_03715 [Peptostreptococcaceae bacterium]|nr:hypothetical protein [Peptostreptococcaceae bacterium]
MTIIVVIILIISLLTIYSIIGALSNKENDEFENYKTEKKEPGTVFKWLYSGKHPQQKFVRNIYKETEDERKKAEIERLKRDRDKEE